MEKEFDVVQKMAEQILTNDTKIFSVLKFAQHLQQAAEAHRYDPVIRIVNDVVQKKAALNPGGLITANEILAIYQQVHGLNLQSKFAEICGEYLPKLPAVTDDNVKQADAIRDTYVEDGVRSLTKQEAKPAEVTATAEGNLENPQAFTQSIEEAVEDGYAKAVSTFKEDTVKLAYETVQAELKDAGFNQFKMHLRAADSKGIVFAATMQTPDGKFSIDVPVEITADQILFPSIFKHEGKEFEFSKKGLNNFVIANKNAITTVKYSADLVDMSYNDIKKVIHQAVLDRNYVRAEEGLALIQDKFGEETHKTAVADYQEMLKIASQDYEQRCSRCSYFASAKSHKATHADDYCNLVRESCKRVTKTASGICVRSSVEFDRIHDKEYQSSAAISNSKIFLT